MEKDLLENVIICRETESNDVSTEEIIEYAKTIGVDCDTERHLLPIAKQALLQKLPDSWIPCFDKIGNGFFYYNTKTGISQWQHPLDDIYKRVINHARQYYKKGSDRPAVKKWKG